MPIEAQRHVEGKPRLQPKMHQAVDWMQKIKVVVQTFAGGELQTQFPAGGVPAQKIGQARLRARPQTDQTFADAVACRHFARDFILPCAVAAQKSNRPPGRFGQYLTLPPHPRGQLRGELFKVLQKHLLLPQVPHQSPHTLQSAHGTAKADAIPAMQNTRDDCLMPCYELTGHIARAGRRFFHSSFYNTSEISPLGLRLRRARFICGYSFFPDATLLKML